MYADVILSVGAMVGNIGIRLANGNVGLPFAINVREKSIAGIQWLTAELLFALRCSLIAKPFQSGARLL